MGYRSWEDNEAENQVIVSHGMMILVTIMRLFKMPISDFDSLESLKNCEFVVLERDVDDAKYHISFTWAHGEEKRSGGLRQKPLEPRPIWNGDPEAELLTSVPRIVPAPIMVHRAA